MIHKKEEINCLKSLFAIVSQWFEVYRTFLLWIKSLTYCEKEITLGYQNCDKNTISTKRITPMNRIVMKRKNINEVN